MTDEITAVAPKEVYRFKYTPQDLATVARAGFLPQITTKSLWILVQRLFVYHL